MALGQIAERLVGHEEEIVDRWIGLQFKTWQPPGLGPEQLKELFGVLLNNLLRCMATGELETCIADLEEIGVGLARSSFPYEALIISLHFLEESYMPFLLSPRSENVQSWLIRMDEFLHVGIAALATSYFRFQREELLAEAEIGRTVQEALFPHPPNRIGDLEIGFIYTSASERSRLGGDFLEVFPFGKDGGAAFVVGDLSGHGLEAAADSATIRSLFKGFIWDKSDLVDVMGRVNRVLIEELEGNQFATAVAGTYEPTGRLTLVNAGSPLPIVSGGGCHLIEGTGLPLAVSEQTVYERTEIELGPGDIFLVCTDGVIEARVGGDLFGEERTLEAVEEMRDASARAIAEHLKDKAIRHAGGRLLDDIAILVLKRIEARDP
jgi:serine phosphatase RsbU (regulator of sigma subunit)